MWGRPLSILITSFRECGNNSRRQFSDDRYPAGLGRLPGILVLAAHVGPVDDLVTVSDSAEDLNRQRRIGDRLEAHGDLAEIEIYIGNILSGLGRDGVQAEGVVAAGDQVGRQHLVYPGIIGFVEDTVV